RHATHAASTPPTTIGIAAAGAVRARRSCSSAHRISARDVTARLYASHGNGFGVTVTAVEPGLSSTTTVDRPLPDPTGPDHRRPPEMSAELAVKRSTTRTPAEVCAAR